MSIQESFESFINSSDLEEGIDLSTDASYAGAWYSVELFEGGHYRILYSEDIENLYDSPGMILPLPTLSGDEDGFYDNAIDELRSAFEAQAPEV